MIELILSIFQLGVKMRYVITMIVSMLLIGCNLPQTVPLEAHKFAMDYDYNVKSQKQDPPSKELNWPTKIVVDILSLRYHIVIL